MKLTVIDRRSHPAGATFSTFTTEDGWSIRRMDWLQSPGGPCRGSLMFAGGRGDFIEKYLEPLAHWHSQGWNVTSFDWRSQGDSRGDIAGGHLESFDPLLADGAALLQEWIGRTAGPHVAVGHSMGGHLLLRILIEHRPALACAVLVAPMIGINTGPLPPWMAQSIAQSACMLGWNQAPTWRQDEGGVSASAMRQNILTTCSERYGDELWWIERQPGFALGPPSWGWLNAAYRSMASVTEDKLRRLDIPVLLLGTDRDRLVSSAAIRWAARLMPTAELLMFPRAAHEILRESDPVRLEALSRIDRFLEAHAGG